jgi:hypothetical protein
MSYLQQVHLGTQPGGSLTQGSGPAACPRIAMQDLRYAWPWPEDGRETRGKEIPACRAQGLCCLPRAGSVQGWGSGPPWRPLLADGTQAHLLDDIQPSWCQCQATWKERSSVYCTGLASPVPPACCCVLWAQGCGGGQTGAWLGCPPGSDLSLSSWTLEGKASRIAWDSRS